jgi:2-polyprenyl-6-methoxyphenol hydroxylase-like FAD-dependent oxidoreductase
VKYEKALVIGGGVAGLVAARVLAKHFNHVILIERDQIPETPETRAGVGQGAHIHTLLPGGLEVLTQLFPTLEQQLDAHGGQAAGPSEWYAYTPRGKTYRLSRFQSTPILQNKGRKARMQTRPLLEHCIRKAVERLPNATLRNETNIGEAIFDAGAMTGVRVKTTGEEIHANLIVDASGRASQTLGWLDQLGSNRPQETVVNCDFAYSTAFFKPNDPSILKDVGFLISSAHKGEYVKRGGSIVRVEGDRWQVTLAGRLGDYPPKTPQGFLDYIATLHSPQITDLLKTATPIGDPKQYLFPKSVRRHYEKLARFPEGLLPIGDALCHFNPGYSQGMSAACRQAAELDALLTERREKSQPLTSLWRDFFNAAHEQTRAPWLFAALIDFSKKGTTGDFPDEEAHAIAAIKRLNKLADEGDAEAAALVDGAFDMNRPLSDL